MRRMNPKMAKLILGIASIVTATALSATAQTSSVSDFAPTVVVSNGVRVTNADDCEERLRVESQRLLKTLDTLSHTENLLTLKNKELEARIALESLYKQAIEVKDLIIKYQGELIEKMRKPNSGFMGRLKQILRTAERLILVAAGIYVGGKL